MKYTLRFCCFFACLTNLTAQDSATVLARILAARGAISMQEAAQVQAAAQDERVQMLAAMLEAKGVLTRNDLLALRRTDAQADGQANSPAVVLIPASYPAPASLQKTSSVQSTASSGGAVDKATPPVTAQTKVPVTIYGTILLNSFLDTSLNNIQDVPTFTGKQGSDALGNDKSFGMTARQSRLGLRYQGGMLMGARTSGQVEIDFFGGKPALGNGINMDIPRLRLAFGRLDWDRVSMIAGQDWSVFAPLNPTSLASFSIPALSASGNPWIRTPQIRGELHNAAASRTKVLLQVAATDPDVGDYQTASFLTARTPAIGERGRTPGADARLAISTTEHGRDFAFGFSTHYSRGKNAGAIGTLTVQRPVDSWGTALDWSLPFTKFFNVTGEAYIGRALGIFSVASGESVLGVGTAGEHGVLSRGGWAQAQVNFNARWQANASYGIDDPRARELPVGNRNRNQTYIGNMMYKVSPNITFALEWRRFLTDFRNQKSANERGDQANLAIGYVF